MPSPDDPDKAWLRRILTPRTATPVLPAPEREKERDQKTRAEDRPQRAPKSQGTSPSAPPRAAQSENAAPARPPASPSPRAENVGPGRAREIKPSERLASLRAGLTAQAHDMADAMPRHASAEARAELSALWQRIKAVGEAIEHAQRAEDHVALLARRQEGKERERER